jgi:hypothetical protein
MVDLQPLRSFGEGQLKTYSKKGAPFYIASHNRKLESTWTVTALIKDWPSQVMMDSALETSQPFQNAFIGHSVHFRTKLCA